MNKEIVQNRNKNLNKAKGQVVKCKVVLISTEFQLCCFQIQSQ